MNLKTKLTLGLVLLFGLLVLVSVLGMYNINDLSTDSAAILKDNYKTLEYVQKMQRALGDFKHDQSSREHFEKYLSLQKKNVTEPGEQDVTEGLEAAFHRLKKKPADSLAFESTHYYLLRIADLNLEAMSRKNEQALRTAEKTAMLLGIIATFCVLIGFTFVVNFPGYIANPIKQLTKGIQEIARGNYEQRVHLDRFDEFGELAGAFNDLASKLHAFEHSNLARIMFEKKRLETVIGAMHDPVIGLDENHLVLFVNVPALALLNLPPSKLIGKDVREVAITSDLLRTLLARSAHPVAEPLKIYADGKESFFFLDAIDIAVGTSPKDDNLQGIGKVLVLKNVTQFRERDMAKTNFIATISHELKTPISSIKMGLRLLDDERIGALNEEQRHLLRQLADDAGRLLNISGELVKIAQAETGNIQLTLTPVMPAEIVDTARQAVAAQAQEKNIELIVDLKVHPDQFALADSDKTTWVLINLLTNAIRYSPENQSVLITVAPEGDQVRFAVQDHGPGIPGAYHEDIFERFFRVPGTKQAGSGLGLAISREFVWAMGGTIGVESEPGQGSTFYFNLKTAG